MSTRFMKQQVGSSAVPNDAETVAALVKMLSGMGIDRSRINAMIDKSARPEESPREIPLAGNTNGGSPKCNLRRSA